MDSGERRRQTARTARLGFLVIANVAAALLLIRSLTGGSGEVGGAPPEESAMEAPSELLVIEEVAEPRRALTLPRLVVTPDAELARRLERHIAAAVEDARRRSQGKVSAANSVIAVHVFDPVGGGALVSRQAGLGLKPASNMKLVTSAAALVTLGPDWNFETRFHSTAPIQGGVLRGDLVVRAGGDPLFDIDADGAVAHLFDPVVSALRSRGIRAVEGALVLDQGSYQEPGPGPGWPGASQHWQEHCALSGGFSANAGCLTAVVESTTAGESARSEVRPLHNGLQRVGTVRTMGARSRLNINVGASGGQATLRGEMPSSVPLWTSRFSHPDPIELFGTTLEAALADGGIELRGGRRRERDLPQGETLATLRTPLETVLTPINRDSNNAVADQLFLALGDALGQGGTRAGGARAVGQALEILGVSAKGLVQVDGSGLSRDDRITAEQLSSLLAGVLQLDPSLRDPFIHSLAVAGRSGSLQSRMKAEPTVGRVFAKTGWIEGSGSLSGYVETLAGEVLCFSILVDYPKVSGLNRYCWKPMQDEICAELVSWERSGGRVR